MSLRCSCCCCRCSPCSRWSSCRPTNGRSGPWIALTYTTKRPPVFILFLLKHYCGRLFCCNQRNLLWLDVTNNTLQVAQMTILPKGEIAGQEDNTSSMLSTESKNQAYFFDYTQKVPEQPEVSRSKKTDGTSRLPAARFGVRMGSV
jgi:hypothetical protein